MRPLEVDQVQRFKNKFSLHWDQMTVAGLSWWTMGKRDAQPLHSLEGTVGIR